MHECEKYEKFIDESNVVRREPIGTRFIYCRTESGFYCWEIVESFRRELNSHKGKTAVVEVLNFDRCFDDINGDTDRSKEYTIRGKIIGTTNRHLIVYDRCRGRCGLPFEIGHDQGNWRGGTSIRTIVVDGIKIFGY